MYTLDTPLSQVKGIGPSLTQSFAKRELHTVKDVLLFLPLRYEDRSLRKMIAQLVPQELVTIEAEVTTSNNYYKGRRSIQSATVKDATGRLKLMWFNNPYVVQRLIKGKTFLISGKLNDRGTMLQPTVENVSDEAIHTGRLVPIYSTIPGIAPTTLRKILKHILEELEPVADPLQTHLNSGDMLLTLALQQIHFPASTTAITAARERFALEEIVSLIQHSRHLKKAWADGPAAIAISARGDFLHLPFELTTAQTRCANEIREDLRQTVPMNRLLIGDVGAGKTAVAAIACHQVLQQKQHVAFVAPTQILAEQHIDTFAKLFPQLPVQLVTSKTSMLVRKQLESGDRITPTVFIGTHALFPLLPLIKPALLIYDEQHRFGVEHRSLAQHLTPRPHVLTLTATPIPRTYMLTIFAHLNVSVIDELPPGRQPVQTWLVPEIKRAASYQWLRAQLHDQQALIVCPFIDPSQAEALENIAAANDFYARMQAEFPDLAVGLLHGRMSKKEQADVTAAIFARQLQIIVTTPIVEVGVDLPAATFLIIEAAERFGLASLHQLRGRVGRAGQQAYCLLFTNATDHASTTRLREFCQIHNGLQLAEMDLQHRGAGDIFGTQQHGFDELRFANWNNVELVKRAKQIADQDLSQWQPFLPVPHEDDEVDGKIPLAN